VLTRMGRLTEADGLFARLQARPSSDPREEALTRMRLGHLRSAQGQYDQALALLRGAVDYFATQSPRIELARALDLLGEAQVAAHDADPQVTQALATYMQAESLFEASQPNLSPDRAEVLTGLARTYLTLGRAEEAVAAATKAVNFWKSFDTGDRGTGAALLWQGRALLAARRPAEAAGALRQAQALLARSDLPIERAWLAQAQRELMALAVAAPP
jgi:tetratricopeptide (TPR) repeat protein